MIDKEPEYVRASNNPCLVKLFPEASTNERTKLLGMFLQYDNHKKHEHWPWDRDSRKDLSFSELDVDLQRHGLHIKVRLLRSTSDEFTVEAKLCSQSKARVDLVMNDVPMITSKNAQIAVDVLGKILENDIICIENIDNTSSFLRFDPGLKRFRKSNRLPKQRFSLKLYRKAYRFLRDTQKEETPILMRHRVFAE